MIRSAKAEDLNQIAALHIECFPDYFLSKLGLNLLTKYYKEFMTPEDIFLIYVDDKRINGLLVGTPNSSIGRNNFIKNNMFVLSLQILRLCIKLDKDTWNRVLEYVKNFVTPKRSSKIAKIQLNLPSLLSICVSDNY